MSLRNSWNTREPAILSVLFPIFFIMSEDATIPAEEVVVPTTPAEMPTETPTEATPAEEGEESTETQATPAE